MIRLPVRDLKLYAALLALDALGALGVTVWALVQVLTDTPPAGWWTVAFGVAVTVGAAGGALWFRRRAARPQTGGAA